MPSFHPKLEILPSAQREIWSELRFAANDFVLYGGTGLALRLGHRQSLDYDFFSFRPFDPGSFLRSQPLLATGETLQMETNTLTVLVSRPMGSVKISFFGGLTFGQVQPPELSNDECVSVASLPDLFATKLNTVYQRAEAKDYLDIHAILQSGLTLEQGIDYARRIYGSQFNAMLPMQALCYFEEPALAALPESVKQTLRAAVRSGL